MAERPLVGSVEARRLLFFEAAGLGRKGVARLGWKSVVKTVAEVVVEAVAGAEGAWR